MLFSRKNIGLFYGSFDESVFCSSLNFFVTRQPFERIPGREFPSGCFAPRITSQILRPRVSKDRENMSTSPVDEQEVCFQIPKIKQLPPLPKTLQRPIEIIYDEVESSIEVERLIAY